MNEYLYVFRDSVIFAYTVLTKKYSLREQEQSRHRENNRWTIGHRTPLTNQLFYFNSFTQINLLKNNIFDFLGSYSLFHVLPRFGIRRMLKFS